MTTLIQANYEALDAIAKRFSTNGEEARQMDQAVRRGVNRLRESWQGTGAAAFLEEMDGELLPAVGRLIAALEQAGTTTSQIATVLRRAEEEAAALFKEEAGWFSNPFSGVDNWIWEKLAGLDITGWENPPAGAVVAAGEDPTNPNPGAEELYHPNDIAQGSIGDCYVASAIASLALQNPDSIQQMITANPDGTYTVRLYKRDFQGILQPVDVTVTASFPVSGSNPVHLRFLDDGGKSEMWPQLIEKAYVQEFLGGGDAEMGYNRADAFGGSSGGVLEALTGQNSTTYVSSGIHGIDTFPSPTQMQQMLDSGYAITVGSRPFGQSPVYQDHGSQGLVSRHMYYVESVDPATGMVTVRNPWGYEDKYKLVLTHEEFTSAFIGMQVAPTIPPPAATTPTVTPAPEPVSPTPAPSTPERPTPAPPTPTPGPPSPAPVPTPPTPTPGTPTPAP